MSTAEESEWTGHERRHNTGKADEDSLLEVYEDEDSSICAIVVSEVGPDLGTTAASSGFGLKQLVLRWFEAKNGKSSTVDELHHVHWCLCQR